MTTIIRSSLMEQKPSIKYIQRGFRSDKRIRRRTRTLATALFVSILAGSILSGCSTILNVQPNKEFVTLTPGQYELDPAHTSLIFKISHLGLATFVGRFNKLNATLDFNPKELEQTRLDASVEMASVDTNDNRIDKLLRGRSWFNVGAHPEAIFKTLSINHIEGSTYNFMGELNFLGITHPVELKIEFHGGANNILTGRYTIGFSATGSIKRSDFGMDKFIPAVGDQVDLEIFAEFLRQE